VGSRKRDGLSVYECCLSDVLKGASAVKTKNSIANTKGKGEERDKGGFGRTGGGGRILTE